MICGDGIVVLQSNTEVVHPSLEIGTDFFVPARHGDAPTAAGKTAQFGLELSDGFPGYGKFLPSEGETEERSLLGLHHRAFPGSATKLDNWQASAWESSGARFRESCRKANPNESISKRTVARVKKLWTSRQEKNILANR